MERSMAATWEGGTSCCLVPRSMASSCCSISTLRRTCNIPQQISTSAHFDLYIIRNRAPIKLRAETIRNIQKLSVKFILMASAYPPTIATSVYNTENFPDDIPAFYQPDPSPVLFLVNNVAGIAAFSAPTSPLPRYIACRNQLGNATLTLELSPSKPIPNGTRLSLVFHGLGGASNLLTSTAPGTLNGGLFRAADGLVVPSTPFGRNVVNMCMINGVWCLTQTGGN